MDRRRRRRCAVRDDAARRGVVQLGDRQRREPGTGVRRRGHRALLDPAGWLGRRRHRRRGGLHRTAGPHDRADLRRRSGPDLDAAGAGGARPARRPGHLLRGRLDGVPAPGAGRAHPPLRVRTGGAHLHPPGPGHHGGLAGRTGAASDAAGARRGHRGHHPPVPAAVLVHRRGSRRSGVPGGARRGRTRVRQRVHRCGQSGLAASGGRRDRRQRDAGERARRHRAAARRRWRPCADGRGAGRADPGAEAAGLPVHHGQRGGRDRRGTSRRRGRPCLRVGVDRAGHGREGDDDGAEVGPDRGRGAHRGTVAGAARPRPAARPVPTCASGMLGGTGPPPGVGAHPRVQRGHQHRRHRPLGRGERPPGRDPRDRRRLHRRHRRRGGTSRPARGAGPTAAQRGQGGGAQRGRGRGLARPRRHGRRGHPVRAGHRARAGAALRGPDGGRGVRQRQDRQPGDFARPPAAHRVRGRLQRRSPGVRRDPVDADRAGCGRRVPAGGAGGGRRAQCADPGRGHRSHDRRRPRGMAHRLPGDRRHLDRGADHRPAAVAAAVPVDVRHDAGGVQAPPGDRRTGRGGPCGPVRPAARPRVPGAAADAGPGDRRLPALRRPLPRSGHHRAVVAVHAGDPGGRCVLRVRPRPGVALGAVAAAHAAAGVPAADVRRPGAVGARGGVRGAGAVAAPAPHRHHAARHGRRTHRTRHRDRTGRARRHRTGGGHGGTARHGRTGGRGEPGRGTTTGTGPTSTGCRTGTRCPEGSGCPTGAGFRAGSGVPADTVGRAGIGEPTGTVVHRPGAGAGTVAGPVACGGVGPRAALPHGRVGVAQCRLPGDGCHVRDRGFPGRPVDGTHPAGRRRR